MYVCIIYLFVLFIFVDRIPPAPGISAPIQTDPGAHPASYTNCTGLLPGGKAAGAWRSPLTPFSAEVKERVEFIPLIPSMLSYRIIG